MARSQWFFLLALSAAIPVGAQTLKPSAKTTTVSSDAESVLTQNGFQAPTEIRFDESMGGKRPIPHIPRSWRFIGVSNGAKINANNLWFQDSSGNIFLIQGFNSTESKYSTTSEFVVDSVTQVLRAQ